MTLAQLILGSPAIFPEILLGAALCLVILGDMCVPLSRSRLVCGWIGVLGLALALLSLAINLPFFSDLPSPFFFSRILVQDRLAVVLQMLILLGTLISLIFALRSRALEGFRFGELVGLLLGAAFGGCLIASSNNFIVFVIGLETLSLCSYVLASYAKHQQVSAEAGLKYTLYGAAASAVMLFGISYIYGLTGSLDIQWSMKRLTPGYLLSGQILATMIGTALVLSGLGFKIAMVPFHFWCPDTYQGAPTPVTAFLSVVSKTAGFAALARVFAPVIIAPEMTVILGEENAIGVLQVIFGILALVTMTYGNLVALRQSNAKRLLAYSSIAHAGYLLMSFAVFSTPAVEVLLFYLAVYLFMNLGAFWVIIALENASGSAELNSYRGVAYKSPTLFIALFICLVALTGIPPTAGFVAKLQLFGIVVKAGLTSLDAGSLLSPQALFFLVLALAGALNSVVSLFYYMKLARVMVFEKDESGTALTVPAFDRGLAVALAIPVLLMLNFGGIFNYISSPFRPYLMALLNWSWIV